VKVVPDGITSGRSSADGSYQHRQMQMLFDKVDELINALRR
jgi:hypothetical protein